MVIILNCNFFFMFIYLAMLGLSCRMWNLVPRLGIKPRPPVLGVWNPDHWTTMEVLILILYLNLYQYLYHRFFFKASGGICLGKRERNLQNPYLQYYYYLDSFVKLTWANLIRQWNIYSYPGCPSLTDFSNSCL